MNWTLIGLILLAICMIVAPFAALRSISYMRARRNARPPAAIEDDDDPDKPTGFW